ncbi:MAG: DNA-binding response regulator [Firmicutes bacterium HGW-Firmicutes-20]|jgi:DNA-binding response OmpR family regulator|nr:MAG: DNA-binding response regulator [Firmicutes bacterium HGW-Firmicutes-20]PKM89601.1 MAG: DNA-binding response regulator [Firmicutes bacterium HGW-Firmicutes-10]
MNILVVDDEQDLRYLLEIELTKANHTVASAADGLKALEMIKEQAFDMIICDIMMPRLDGLNLLRQIRQFSMVPFLFLTARGEEMDKVLGFGLGADDYLVKPFAMAELLARVEAIGRRSAYVSQHQHKTVVIGKLSLDAIACQIMLDGQPLELNTKEYLLLKYFMEHPGQVFTKAQLYEAIWQQDAYSDDNTVMVHISHLRKLIEEQPKNPQYIQTVFGIGYRFKKAGSGQ